jgi:hypothetical protein
MKVEDESSRRREERATKLGKHTNQEILELLADQEDTDFPIYMQGKVPSLKHVQH